MLRETPVLAERVHDKSRSSGNTILQKIFPGGFVTIAGANSPTGLRSHTVRILLADEIDGYPASAGNEGDPLLLATKRQTTYWNKKQVDISTPTIKGASRIEIEYENSSRGGVEHALPMLRGNYSRLHGGMSYMMKKTCLKYSMYVKNAG